MKAIGIIDPQGRTTKEVEPSDIAPTLRAQTHGNEPEIVIPVLTPERAEKRQNGRRFKDDGEPMFTLTAQDRHGVAIGIDISRHEAEINDGTAHCLLANDQRKIFGTGQKHTMAGVGLKLMDVYDSYNKNWIGEEEIGTITSSHQGSGKFYIAGEINPIGGIYNDQKDEYQRGILDGTARALKAEKADGCVALGVLRDVRSEYGKEIRKDYEAGNLDISRHEFLEKEIREDGVTNTLDSVQKDNYLAVRVAEGEEGKEHPGIYVELYEDCTVYAVWYEKYQCWVAIRKLLPIETFFLQGFTREDFEKAQFVNSDSQLYKQSGNSISVPIPYAIGKKLAEIDDKRGRQP